MTGIDLFSTGLGRRAGLIVALSGALWTGIASSGAAQSFQQGDQVVSLSYSVLERFDTGTRRDTATVMLSYANQITDDLRLMAFLGRMTTNNSLPPDTQTVRAPTLGFGASYRIGAGTTITGTFLFNNVAEEYRSPTLTARGTGQNRTATLQINQVIPVSQRTFLTGSLSASVSEAKFQSPGFGIARNPYVERYIAGLEVTHILTPNWILAGGIDHTQASNTITMKGDRHLTRAKLGATFLIDADTGVTASYTTGIGAEQTRRILSLALTRRF